ncbi:hypothetical protein [uncultured Clostridium sp.]|jgi:hypothetical protein|uniref:hypothetical protein n=1 Tax=uncultured Clostridium sp. TaxID=59620 RepID=UPI00260197B5|nr:hypothetical protein [uncultured Clostridium sp.]
MKIAFLDLEFTRKPYDTSFVNEIIEISCITAPIEDSYKLNDDGFLVSSYKFKDQKDDKFTCLVKPSINTFLTKEIVEYTGITQREVDNNGTSLEESIKNLYTYLKKSDIKRIYIYSRYSKDLLTGAKRILRGRLDKKINYIINLLKDISYYSSIARERVIMNLDRTSNFDVQYSREKLSSKKKFSLTDTYLVLMNKKEINDTTKTKSLADAKLIKDIFFSEEKNIESELSEIAYRIEIKREKLYSIILSKKDFIEWVCSATSAEDLKVYKNEDLQRLIKAMVIIIKEFKGKVLESGIKLSEINVNDKWLILYREVRKLAEEINSTWGLKVKSVKECMDILQKKEKKFDEAKVDAKLTAILMESHDDFEQFKEDIKPLEEEEIKLLIIKCKNILDQYDNGHAFKTYTTKLSILEEMGN